MESLFNKGQFLSTTGGFVTYSKGNATERTLFRRDFTETGFSGPGHMICVKGNAGGDIQGVISNDGKWLAFSRSIGGTGEGFGGDDYHSFARWDIYVVRLDSALPAEPVKVGHGYFPSWGDDSGGETKTLYYCVYENKSIRKVCIGPEGSVSESVVHFSVSTHENDLHMQCSPDGCKVAYREDGTVWIMHIGGPLKGQKFKTGGGCHPSWCAGSEWLIFANHSAVRHDGTCYTNALNGAGDYHYGTSADLSLFVTRTTGDWRVQNHGGDIHLMAMKATDREVLTFPDQKILVTPDGSWCDVHSF